MKAIGATNRNVLHLFLIEGATISFLGGIVGIVFGFIGSAIICSFVSEYVGTSFSAVITPGTIVLSLFVALIVGVAFSYYPAKRAATLNPVVAISSQ